VSGYLLDTNVIVTRNTKHFQVFGIDAMSPDETTPSA